MGQKLQPKKQGDGELQHPIKISNLIHQVINDFYSFFYFSGVIVFNECGLLIDYEY